MESSILPTTTVTTTLNNKGVTFVYPCVATNVNGCYVHSNSAAYRPRLSAVLWVTLFLLFSSAFVLAVASNTDSVLEFEDMPTAIDQLAGIHNSAAASDYTVLVGEDLVGISNFTLEAPTNYRKRWNAHNAPLGASWVTYRIADQGLFWSEWTPASCAQSNPYDVAADYFLVSKWCYTANWAKGFKIELGIAQAAQLGYVTARKVAGSETVLVPVPCNNTGQLWSQQLVVWQNQETQKCKKLHYGSGGIHCDKWKGPFRGNLPVLNQESFGFSVGAENVDSASCGPVD